MATTYDILRGVFVFLSAGMAVNWGIGSGMAAADGRRGECRGSFLMAYTWALAAGAFAVLP